MTISRFNTCLFAALLMANVIACRRQEASAPSVASIAKSIEQQQAELDATVWRDEVIAQQHERTMVRLADELRRAVDKSAVLEEFPFQTISIPRTKGAAVVLPLGIREQHFDDAANLMLNHDSWRAALQQFQKAGWKLVQFEWQHEKFVPAAATNGAISEFAFELHGEQPSQTNRFIISGKLVIDWERRLSTNETAKARQIRVRDLSLIERNGKPGFNDHLLLAPEPDRPNGQLNLHPVIVTDINGDLHDDIVLPSVNKVLLNDGRAQFQAATLIDERNFVPLQNVGAIADFTGDGKLDFLGVADLGPMARMVVLFPGGGTLPFAASPLVAWEAQRTDFNLLKITSASAMTVGDIDGDGDLDIYVAQYRPPYTGGQLPTPYYDANDGFSSFLLLNDGRGKFEQAKSQPSLRAKGHRRTLSASLVDLDGDGDLDLVTANDYSGIDLFYNDGKGNFTDETARLDNRSLFGMALSFADFDGDGALDLFATGMSIPTVHRLESIKLAPKEFADRTAHRADMGYGNRLFVSRAGKWIQPPWSKQFARTGWTWGVAAFDFDNNGGVDLYAANGHVSGESSADYDSECWSRDIYLGTSREDANLKRYFDDRLASLNAGKTSWAGFLHNAFYLDAGSNRFVNAAFLMGVAHESDCRAVVSADFNEDGRRDLVVTEAKWQGTPNIMRHRLLLHLNESVTSNHWIGVRFADTSSAIGAKVFVTSERGTRVAQVVAGDSFQSQQSSTAHFGLGESQRVIELRVAWPNGRTTKLTNPQVDRWHVVKP